MPERFILITNDDGIDSPGLRAAVEAVIDLGEIIVVAPSTQQTAMSRALYGAKDEYLKPLDFQIGETRVSAYHINASPAMAVQHAYNVLFFERQPDLIISGINYGENLGWDSMLSGTVGAAFQGASQGTPAIAVSLQTEIEHHFVYGEVDWSAAKHFLKLYSERILKDGICEGVKVLKIDVPAEATTETEWRYTKLADQHYFTAEIENPSLESRLGDAKVKIKPIMDNLDKESDIYALAVDKIVSVTPMNMDMSVHK
ncbi:MAG: 5'/3'-nucleotidase SurE [Bacteroidetes bacterium]|nr:5'/3'-nucleotidase SurE [Bacteroidota bacterium]